MSPSLNNGQLHGFAMAGTTVLTGSLFGVTLYMTQATAATHEPPLKEMITIEASLARKSEKKVQPQKELKAPEPPVKPEGVSREELKKPIEKKPEEHKKPPPKKDDKPVDLSRFRHPTDDDLQTGSTATTSPGQFDGSKEGFAQINAGNPYWQHFVADFKQVWELPSISKVNGATKACFHIEPDGKIADTKFEHSGDDMLDDSVQRAMKATKKTRNEKPQPVPTEQLGVIRSWVCFRFNPNQ
jgi:outer membrane biosynthesis protein TonB